MNKVDAPVDAPVASRDPLELVDGISESRSIR